MPERVTYKSEIIKALKQLGGMGSLKEINSINENNGELSSVFTTKDWDKNVSAVLQRYCSSTKSYLGKEDIFYSVYGLGEGYWGLNSYKERFTEFELNPIERRKVEEVKSDFSLSNTEKEQIVLARRGQGVFRKQLIDRYQVCIITGINDERLLCASHIKPWRNSNDSERLSVYNGFLLSSLYDKMFDVGLITFTVGGYIAVSENLCESDREIIDIDLSHKYLNDIPIELKRNIEYHNDCIFIK